MLPRIARLSEGVEPLGSLRTLPRDEDADRRGRFGGFKLACQASKTAKLAKTEVDHPQLIAAVGLLMLLSSLSIAEGDPADAWKDDIPEIATFITDAGPKFVGMGGGCMNYVVSRKLAAIIETRGTIQMLAAATSRADATHPPLPDRMADLAVIILSKCAPERDGWMTDQQRQRGMRVCKVPFVLDRAIRRGFPKEGTPAQWSNYFKAVTLAPSEK